METIRMFIANIGSTSKEGHRVFTEYIESFAEVVNLEEMKQLMSEGMQKFLRVGQSREENEDK